MARSGKREMSLYDLQLDVAVNTLADERTYVVILTFFKWQFMLASTPTIVPLIDVPFFNSIVTTSRFNFWRNFTSFMFEFESSVCISNISLFRSFN